MPANSDTTRPRFATTRQTTANAASRSGKFARMSDTSPWPV